MKRVVLCCLPAVSCGYDCGASLLCVTEESLCMVVSVVMLVSLLLVGCCSRSLAREPDSNVANRDPFSLVVTRFLDN